MPTFTVDAKHGTRGVTVTDNISGVQQREAWVQSGATHDFIVIGGDDGEGVITLVTRPVAVTISTIQMDHASVSDGDVIDLI